MLALRLLFWLPDLAFSSATLRAISAAIFIIHACSRMPPVLSWLLFRYELVRYGVEEVGYVECDRLAAEYDLSKGIAEGRVLVGEVYEDVECNGYGVFGFSRGLGRELCEGE